MERVSIFQTSQRFEDGGSSIQLEKLPKITPESQAEIAVGFDGFPPLQGARMLVCSNRWYNDSYSFRPLQGESFFIVKLPAYS
jgi:hypothetical protein